MQIKYINDQDFKRKKYTKGILNASFIYGAFCERKLFSVKIDWSNDLFSFRKKMFFKFAKLNSSFVSIRASVLFSFISANKDKSCRE